MRPLLIVQFSDKKRDDNNSTHHTVSVRENARSPNSKHANISFTYKYNKMNCAMKYDTFFNRAKATLATVKCDRGERRRVSPAQESLNGISYYPGAQAPGRSPTRAPHRGQLLGAEITEHGDVCLPGSESKPVWLCFIVMSV